MPDGRHRLVRRRALTLPWAYFVGPDSMAHARREYGTKHRQGKHAYTTVLLSVPRPEIEMSIMSPALRKRGGSKPMPTPAGVPVAMMSPGFNLIPADKVSMR